MTDAIAVQFAPVEATQLCGRHLVQHHRFFYPPQVTVEDLLEVDFDRKQIGPDGIYLVERVEGGRVTWCGARRFHHNLNGLYIDQSGEGDHQRVKSPAAVGLRVIGYVVEVYRPSRRVNGQAAAMRRAS